ncbi:MAG: hypothetical protein HF314_05925 [Ignavibacteria bacterium]|jgi:flagellar hook-length control protein FliK|nr:hypothetical protein [Ignavibacteria bacterium]MCU7502590.1 hypothetical protein [Ignavibacteria bacterium]MCU7515207.1 hypothetical protein [Ignavibacteria bacterium]
MVFNPLFLQVVNNQDTQLLSKSQKLTGPSYLFSDIIKVQLDKTDATSFAPGQIVQKGIDLPVESNLLGGIVSVLSGEGKESSVAQLNSFQLQNAGMVFTNPGFHTGSSKKALLPDTWQSDLVAAGSSETDDAAQDDPGSLLVGNTELYNFISGLLNNQQFNGKISIVNSEGSNEEGSEGGKSSGITTLPVESLNAGEILELLKKGNTLAVENSASQSNKGLLITLVEVSKEAAKKDAEGMAQGVAGTDSTMANSGGDVASSLMLTDLIATHNEGAETGSTGLSEPVYKLKFSLLSNLVSTQDTMAPVSDTQTPIIKLPFGNVPGLNGNPFKYAGEMPAADKNLSSTQTAGQSGTGNTNAVQSETGVSKNSVIEAPAGVNVKPDVQAAPPSQTGAPTSGASDEILNGSAAVESLTKESASQEAGTSTQDNGLNASGNSSPVNKAAIDGAGINDNGVTANTVQENESPAKEDSQAESTLKGNAGNGKAAGEDSVKDNSESRDALKHNVSKGNEPKAGAFSNIERVKTDSSIQSKETQASELSEKDMQKKDVQDPEAPNPVEKKDLPVAGTKQTDPKETLKTDSSTTAAATSQKEKELKLFSTQDKQETQGSLQTDKTEVKDAPKSEMNSSAQEQGSKSTEQQNAEHQNAEHTEVKGKQQEDHQFSIGSQQTKPNDISPTVKRTSENVMTTQAERTVKAAEVMKEISKFIQQGDRSSIVLKIDPENLGTVKIALDIADKVVHANIEVENEAARKMMENNLNQLYSSMNQSGVQLSSVNISLANSDQRHSKLQNPKRRMFTGEGDKDSDEIDGLRQKQMGYNTYDYLI